jgi:hypothetical protein
MTEQTQLLAPTSLFSGAAIGSEKKTQSFMLDARLYTEFTVLFLHGEKQSKRLMAMFAVDHEIGIERQYGMLIVNFGHPYNTRVGERHWSISIFLMQLAKGGNMLIDAERDPKRTIFEEFEQSILASRKPGEQMHRFR